METSGLRFAQDQRKFYERTHASSSHITCLQYVIGLGEHDERQGDLDHEAV